MSNESKKDNSLFLTLLLLVFITLKLCGVINWSWWWVLSPLWGGFAFAIILLGILFIILKIKEMRNKCQK